MTGSTAIIAYGVSRFITDVNIVPELPIFRIGAFFWPLSEAEYYVRSQVVASIVPFYFHFFLIHRVSALKIYFIIFSPTDFNHFRMSRSRDLPVFEGQKRSTRVLRRCHPAEVELLQGTNLEETSIQV